MEVWKDIKGYEGLYQISNMGRVKSLARITNAAHERNTEDKILKQIEKKRKGRKQGYLITNLSKNNKQKIFYIHRLVADAFIENPEHKKTVNHKDGNKHNNCVDNLEWNTYRENNIHAINTGLITSEHRRNCKGSKPVYQYDRDLNLINVYPSMREAERQTKICIRSIGYGIAKGWKFGGYIWRAEPIV